MNDKKYLSDVYQQYIGGALSKKNLEGRLYKYLLDNLDRYRLFDRDQDQWSEFLSWLYPRLSRAIDIYRDQGSSFDAYIAGLVYNASREYRCREADRNMTEYVCWRAKAEEMRLHENEPEYQEPRKNVSIPDDIHPRQVLFLLLKSYYYVSDEFAGQVAKAIGMEAEVVITMIDELRDRRARRQAELVDLLERIQCQHYRCLAYEKRMIAAHPGTEYREKMKDRFERAKKRLHNMKRRLGKVQTSASNRMIAEILGIPKGTVDSGLSKIKNHLAASEDPALRCNPAGV